MVEGLEFKYGGERLKGMNVCLWREVGEVGGGRGSGDVRVIDIDDIF